MFQAFTFILVETAYGWFQAHAYRFNHDTSTFIVETTEPNWRAAGLDQLDTADTIGFCERLFEPWLQGHPLLANMSHLRGSQWLNFPRVANECWVMNNVVLMGDAAHSAHFSIGSGTKLALEDAIALARSFDTHGTNVPIALAAYETERKVEVLRVQSAARNSTEWFENVARYVHLEPEQFAYSLLTRSQRISHENLRLRDRPWLEGMERWLAASVRAIPRTARSRRCSCRSDSARCPSPTGSSSRRWPPTARGTACPTTSTWSILAPAHLGGRGWCSPRWSASRRTVASRLAARDFGRKSTCAPGRASSISCMPTRMRRSCLQLGHSGPKGSTQVGWEDMDAPLPHGNWELIAPSPVPWSPRNQIPHPATRTDMDAVRDAFVNATRFAAQAGFDMIELHAAHGYLLSSFISPLTNQRRDIYGGSLDNRLRFPLEVFTAMREVWPADKPMSVRISATDWVEGGITGDDAVDIARRFKDAGVDLMDVSAGQTSVRAQPVYGRMFQTPFADRIRNEVGIATMAVGNITEPDHVNAIIAAGRADLCALARPHLSEPHFALRAAAALGYTEQWWPRQYLAGKAQIERLIRRGDTDYSGVI